MDKAIIIGAASGMGKQVAKLLSQKNYALALADNQFDLLRELSEELLQHVIIKKIDVRNAIEARKTLAEMIDELGGLDVFIYSAGIADKSGIWENEYHLHQVNSIGFAALTNAVFNYYQAQNKQGHIVGISSLLAMRGFYFATPYCASKAFMRGYMQGLRHESARRKLGITVTEIRPGFVNTSMIKNQKGVFWVCSVQKAATQILDAIDKKKKWAYVTKRWELIGLLCKFLPDKVLHNLNY